VTTASHPAVFISHEGDDATLAGALVAALVSLGVPHEEIRWTSGPATQLEPGVSYAQQLAMDIANAKVFIALLTPRFLASPWCLCELGAAWGRAAQRLAERPLAFIPLCVPPLRHDDLVAILRHIEVVTLDEAGADRLCRETFKALDRQVNVPAWTPAKSALLAAARAAAATPPPARPQPLKVVPGLFLTRHLVKRDGFIEPLSDATAGDLELLAKLKDPLEGDVFRWSRAAQYSLMFESEGRIEAVKLLLAEGTVAGQTGKDIVTHCVSSSTDKDVHTFPIILKSTEGGWERLDLSKLDEPTVETHPVPGQRGRDVRLVMKTWRWSPPGLALTEGDRVRILEMTHYPTAFFPGKRGVMESHDFWMIGIHVAVSGRTTYAFESTGAVKWFESLYAVSSMGLMPVDRDSFAHHRGSNAAQRHEDLDTLRAHCDTGGLGEAARKTVDRFLARRRLDCCMDFWIDAGIDTAGAARQRFIVFAELASPSRRGGRKEPPRRSRTRR